MYFSNSRVLTASGSLGSSLVSPICCASFIFLDGFVLASALCLLRCPAVSNVINSRLGIAFAAGEGRVGDADLARIGRSFVFGSSARAGKIGSISFGLSALLIVGVLFGRAGTEGS